jgi:hypothetical protein
MHTFSDLVCILYGSFQHFSQELCAYPLHLVLQQNMLELLVIVMDYVAVGILVVIVVI